MGGGEKQLKNKWAVEFKEDETITLIEVGAKKRADTQAVIELETLTDEAVSITTAKKKKSTSSTTVIEVGGEMRTRMTHADAASKTKCSEVKSRAKRITDDVDRLAKIERGRRIFERMRVRTEKVAKSA